MSSILLVPKFAHDACNKDWSGKVGNDASKAPATPLAVLDVSKRDKTGGSYCGFGYLADALAGVFSFFIYTLSLRMHIGGGAKYPVVL